MSNVDTDRHDAKFETKKNIFKALVLVDLSSHLSFSNEHAPDIFPIFFPDGYVLSISFVYTSR